MRVYDDGEKYENEDCVRHMSFRSYSIEKFFFSSSTSISSSQEDLSCVVFYCVSDFVNCFEILFVCCVCCFDMIL